MTNTETEAWMDRLGKDRKWLVEASGYSINSLNNTFAGKERTLNERMTKAFEKAFLEEERRRNVDLEKPDASVWDLVMFTGKEVTQINEGRRIGGYDKVEDLYHDAVINFCDELISKESPTNITPLLKKKAHLMAAAGPGIMAEVMDWEGEDDTVSVKICGNSMFPKFEDGDVIDLTHKRASRSPFMRKGLIYLVEYDGGWMVKEYNTRKATQEDEGADYLTSHGTVGVLKSLNPEFKSIDITGPFEWAAWYDEPTKS